MSDQSRLARVCAPARTSLESGRGITADPSPVNLRSSSTPTTPRVVLPERSAPPVSGAADRLARLIIRLTTAPDDVKTTAVWAEYVCVSRGALRGYCYAAGLAPKRALDSARLLRAVVRSNDGGWQPAEWLDVSDVRHLRGLLHRGGLQDWTHPEPPRFEDFLTAQSLIPATSCVLGHIRTRLGLQNDRQNHRQ